MDSAIRKLAMHFLLMPFILAASANIAAQTITPHQVWTTNVVPGQFSSEASALSAVRSLGGHYRLAEVVEYTTPETDRIVYGYKAAPKAALVGTWTYNLEGADPQGEGASSSEEGAIAAKLAIYNARYPTCNFVSIVPTSQWTMFQRWYDGTNSLEARLYEMTAAPPLGQCSLKWTVQGWRSRPVSCPEHMAWNGAEKTCARGGIATLRTAPIPCGGCDYRGNPISLANGDKRQIENDISLPWVSFSRIYQSSVPSVDGRLGNGWNHSLNIRMALGRNNPSLIVDGRTVINFLSTTGGYEATDGSGWRLTNQNGYVLTRNEDVLKFNVYRLVESITKMDGSSLVFAYDAYNRISLVTHSSGRNLRFLYDDAGNPAGAKVSSIESGGATLVTYAYDGLGRLVAVKHQDGSERRYHYENPDFPNHLTGITDESGVRFSTYQYDEAGKAISSQHAGGVEKNTFSYQSDGSTRHVNSAGEETIVRFTGDSAYRKALSEETSNGTSVTTYASLASDFRRRPIKRVNARGIETTYQYADITDPVLGNVRIETRVDAAGTPQARTSQTWTSVSTAKVLRHQQSNRRIDHSLNGRGQRVLSTDVDTATSNARSVSITYCEQIDVDAGVCPRVGLVRSIDGERTDLPDVTSYEYYATAGPICGDSLSGCGYRTGDLWRVTDALGRASEVLAYDTLGRPIAIRDANGVVTEKLYYLRGWVASVTVVGGTHSQDRTTLYDYWPTGLVKKVTQPDGAFTSYEYDAAHRLTAITDNAGNRIEYVLDNAGNRIKEDTKDAGGQLKRTLSRIYNQLGQLKTQADALANPTDFTYDATGNVDTVTDALGRVTDNNYDPLNRLARTLQDVGGIAAETKFQYDALDNLTKVTDPKGLDTTYTYNGLGDLVQLQSPDTGTTTYTYDSAGNRASQTDARGVTTTYQYDALNRLTQVGYPDPSLNVTYTYDATPTVCESGETFTVGRLTGMQDHSGTTQYCHDRFGNLVRKVQVTNGIAFVLRYAYTASGQLQGMTYPDGMVVDYVRNALGQVSEVGVTRVGQPRATLLHEATYHPFGPVAGWTYGNGRLMQRQVDQDYRPVSIQGGADGLDLTFGFDAVGNLTELASGSPPPLSHRYDALGRLTEVRHGLTQSVIDTYAYDKTGNRTAYTTTQGTDVYNYPANSHRLVDVGGVIRSYDAAGNTLAIGAAREFVYNDTGRMSQVKQGGVVTQQYAYNGRGEQVRRYLGATSTHTLYDEAGHWLGDHDSAGNPIQQAIWMDDMPVGLLANGGQLHYVQPDHLGTPRAVIDPVRDVAVWNWDLKGEVFGNTPPEQDADGDGIPLVFDMRFPGQRHDAEGNQNYNYFRDYEPSTGRHPQSDPIGLSGGVSTYGYVYSSPLIWSDPLGLTAKEKGAAIGCAIGGGVGSSLGAAGGGLAGGAAGLSCGPGAVACSPAAAGGGGVVGWTVGGALGCISGASTGYVIGAILDACSESVEDKAKRCDENLAGDNATCDAIWRAEKAGKRPRGAAARCYASAMQRYGNCLAGRDPGPLDTWNN